MIQVLAAIAALYPLLWAINSARHMNWRTCHRVRAGVVIVGVSAFGLALVPLYGVRYDWLNFALLIGVSVMLTFDRRTRR